MWLKTLVIACVVMATVCATSQGTEISDSEKEIISLVKKLKEMHSYLVQKDKETRKLLRNLTTDAEETMTRRKRNAQESDASQGDRSLVCVWNSCEQKENIFYPGPTGGDGRKGTKGMPGEVGPKGDKGFPGPRGRPGEDGDIGTKGERGVPGIFGPKGDRGVIGARGRRGHRGHPGPKGEKGDSAANLSASTVYIRFGSSVCPRTAQLVYGGYAAGAGYNVKGGGANYLCLPRDPQYKTTVSGTDNWRARVEGAEYEIVDFPPFAGKDDGDVPCAVCLVTDRSLVMMEPARTSCRSGWTREYHGYLMASRFNYMRSEWACVDQGAEMVSSASTSNSDGALFYPVESRTCGYTSDSGLPESIYPDGRELSCVVCSI